MNNIADMKGDQSPQFAVSSLFITAGNYGLFPSENALY
jgi:hypothetical protein